MVIVTWYCCVIGTPGVSGGAVSSVRLRGALRRRLPSSLVPRSSVQAAPRPSGSLTCSSVQAAPRPGGPLLYMEENVVMGLLGIGATAASFGRDLSFDIDRIAALIDNARRSGVGL